MIFFGKKLWVSKLYPHHGLRTLKMGQVHSPWHRTSRTTIPVARTRSPAWSQQLCVLLSFCAGYRVGRWASFQSYIYPPSHLRGGLCRFPKRCWNISQLAANRPRSWVQFMWDPVCGSSFSGCGVQVPYPKGYIAMCRLSVWRPLWVTTRVEW